jgi:hypothetical protein
VAFATQYSCFLAGIGKLWRLAAFDFAGTL